MNTAVIVPTLNAGSAWSNWIKALLATGVNVKDVYVVDSGSIDETVRQASKAGFNIKHIEPGTFNHGGTRQSAVADLETYDLIVFLTQDAILYGADAIDNLLLPFNDDKVGAVCGRQLPRKNAGVIEAHARLLNYPENSAINAIKDACEKGLKTAFLSNSFAAYRASALKEVGGFPANVIFGEDMYVATKLLKAGYYVAYEADACVYHSHGYSLWQEMERYFDMGVLHAREPWIRQTLGGAEGEGIKFVASEARYLLKHAFWRIPEAFFRVILRYTGFRLGLLEKRIPLKLKRFFAMNKSFFKE